MRKKDKGFTLIELLATVAIASVITAIGVFAVQKIIKATETKKQEISIKNIVKSASQYTEEFKTLDKYWMKYKNLEIEEDNNKDNKEYACTTVGMLINKGFLKKDVIGLKIEVDGKEETVSESTSIKIDRDVNTKVFNSEDISFETTECSETANIDLDFEVIGKNTNCDNGNFDGECPYKNWFNKDVTIKINATSSDKIDVVEYFKNDNNVENPIKNLSVDDEKGNDWNIVVGDQGRNIDVCIRVWDSNGNKIPSFCISEDNLTYNMDKELPTVPAITLRQENANVDYKLISNGSTDKITNSELLEYHLSDPKEDGNPIKTQSTSEIPNNLKFENGIEVKSYTVDEAGNQSPPTTKNLTIATAQNGNTSTKTSYFCSFDPTKIYDSQENATNNCSKTENGTVSSKTTYSCSFDTSKSYDSQADATNNCSETENGTITSSTKYSCPNGGTRSGTKCTKTTTDTKTVSGSGKYTMKCIDGKWYDQGNYSFTNNGCPTGYDKTSYRCSGCSSCGSTCSSEGATKTQTESCTNTCKKTTTSTYTATATTTYYCSYTGNTGYTTKTKAQNACKKTTTGTVSSTTKYYCSLKPTTSYTTEDNAKNNCSKTTTGNVSSTEKYYCDLFNGQEFSSITEAQNKCKEQCIDGGELYSNGCYSLK